MRLIGASGGGQTGEKRGQFSLNMHAGAQCVLWKCLRENCLYALWRGHGMRRQEGGRVKSRRGACPERHSTERVPEKAPRRIARSGPSRDQAVAYNRTHNLVTRFAMNRDQV